MNDDQDQITASLEERAARKRAELGLERPPAEPAGTDINVGMPEDTVCDCGATYQASLLRNKDAVIRFPPRCTACRERDLSVAQLREAEREREHQAQRESREQKARASRLELLAVPRLYADATLDSFQQWGDEESQRLQLRVLGYARRYLTQWPDVAAFVVFRGPFGAGKGHIAWAIAKGVVTDLGATARVVKLPALVRQLRDTWRRDSDRTYDTILAQYVDCDLLVIDEASRHAFYGQQIHQHLYDVVDARIEARRPTILTSNEDDEGLLEVLKAALFNRLEGEGGIVEFPNASWRSRPREDVSHVS